MTKEPVTLENIPITCVIHSPTNRVYQQVSTAALVPFHCKSGYSHKKKTKHMALSFWTFLHRWLGCFGKSHFISYSYMPSSCHFQ